MRKIVSSAMPALGGAGAMLLFFLYGLINNLSMSYMGNTSEAVVDFILGNFLGTIVVFMVKVLALYLVLGALSGFFILGAVRGYEGLTSKRLSPRVVWIITAAGTFMAVLLLLFRDIILYPQVYINNFYVKGRVLSFFFDFLTSNFHPAFFTALLWIAVAALICLTAAGALRRGCHLSVSLYLGVMLVLMASAFLYLKSPAPETQNRAEAGSPSIIILGSDALRPDHFSGYGYHRNTTPNIDALIREGVSFTNTRIEVPRTFPSWVSILTGQFSATHGIRHMFPTSRDLNREFKSMVKIMNAKGYYTAVTGDYAADIFTRIDLGFQRVDAPYFNFNSIIQQAILENHTFLLPFLTARWGLSLFPVLRDSAYFCPPFLVRDRIKKEINRAGDRPFFIASFFSSTHFPYAPPYPYYRMYTDPKYDGQYRYFKQRTISLEGESGYEKVTPADIRQIRALYDGGLRAFDDAVGGVIDHLKASGRFENTIVVVLSDHGENLYEADGNEKNPTDKNIGPENLGMGHGEHFRGSYSTKIPFIIRFPKKIPSQRKVDAVARPVDIAPTLLDLAGEKTPPSMEGVSLVEMAITGRDMKLKAFGETGIWFDNSLRDDLFFQKLRILYPDITGISEIDFHFDNQIVLSENYRDLINLARHRYVFDGRYKLIYMPLSDRVEYELYDTKSDPGEMKNRAGFDSANLARMKKLLFDWAGRNGDVVIYRDYIFPRMRY